VELLNASYVLLDVVTVNLEVEELVLHALVDIIKKVWDVHRVQFSVQFF